MRSHHYRQPQAEELLALSLVYAPQLSPIPLNLTAPKGHNTRKQRRKSVCRPRRLFSTDLPPTLQRLPWYPTGASSHQVRHLPSANTAPPLPVSSWRPGISCLSFPHFADSSVASEYLPKLDTTCWRAVQNKTSSVPTWLETCLFFCTIAGLYL